MDAAAFEELVIDELDRLPDDMVEGLENVVFVVEDRPEDGSLDLLGLYDGLALTERTQYGMGELPDRIVVYREPQTHWDLYQLGEELTDLEDAFRLWRFRHVTTVERVIGFKRGTGGTGGVSYLRKMLDVVLFPEIWTLRTSL